MAEELTIKAGSRAEFIFTRRQATDLLFARWQVSVEPSVFSDRPRSFFGRVNSTLNITPITRTVLVSVPVQIPADFNILELLATFSFRNPSADNNVQATFSIRDSLSGFLGSVRAQAQNGGGLASGAVVVRATFDPRPRIFTLEVIADGPISIEPDEEFGDNASLYIQEMSA